MKLQLQGKFNPVPSETYIGLIDVNQIPYHLLVVSCGKQFSWEVKKPRIGENANSLIRHLNRDQTSAVFLKISEDESTLSMVESAYSVPESEETCMGPIIKLVRSLGVEMKQEPLTIFELINELGNAGFEAPCFGLNICVEDVQLTEYSRKEVDQHISQLLGEIQQ